MSNVIHKNDPTLGDNLIQDYIDIFSTYSFKNELYGRLSLHVLLGQAISKSVYFTIGARRIDPRIHLLLIKPQGSGKGAGFGFVERMARELGLDFQSLTEATDAGLVGTLDRDENGDTIVVPGLLRTADIVGMEEASVLFDYTSEFSKKNMTYMQITMNPLEDSSCFIRKRLGPETIEFAPHASFLLMTYPPDRLVDKLLKTGFVDRVIALFEDVTLEDRIWVIRKMTENINKLSKKEANKKFDGVKNRLKAIIRLYTETNANSEIKIPKDVQSLLVGTIEEFAMKILDASPKAREKLEHFVNRLYEILIKLAIHHAILDMRDTLDVSDVIYARLTYLPVWNNLIISIESLLIISDVERFRRNRIIRQSIEEYDRILQEESAPHVKKGVWVRRLTMVDNLRLKWDHCTKETADNNLRKIEKSNQISLEGFGKIPELEQDKFFEKTRFGNFDYVKKIKDIK